MPPQLLLMMPPDAADAAMMPCFITMLIFIAFSLIWPAADAMPLYEIMLRLSLIHAAIAVDVI